MYGMKWKNPGRKRNCDCSYSSPDYVPGYDLDQRDFTEINEKKKLHGIVTKEENDRYGDYIMAITEIVLEGPKFKEKPLDEKYELRDQMTFELLCALDRFDPTRGSKIFSYAYRCSYVAACHYYKYKQREAEFARRVYEIIHNRPRPGHKVHTSF